MQFLDREDAGIRLAKKLESLRSEGTLDLSDAIVIALPRGGVTVANQVAIALHLPLDVCVVRKVGAPGHRELAVAAVSEGGETVVNENICVKLGLSTSAVMDLAEPERKEVEQRITRFRAGRAAIPVENKTVILVDDGLATGATALVAIQVLKRRGAKQVVLAVPVCPYDAVDRFEKEADSFVYLDAPQTFYAVGQWYRDFDQVTDDEVKRVLADAHRKGDKRP